MKRMTPFHEKRPKSTYSHYSTESQKEAYSKLKALRDEEEKIKQQKDELLKFLESRSQAKTSSRPTTVASLCSRNATTVNTPIPILNNKSNLPDLIPQQRQNLRSSHSKNHSAVNQNRKTPIHEIKELIKGLF